MLSTAERNRARYARMKRHEDAYHDLTSGLDLVLELYPESPDALAAAVRGALARAARTAAGGAANEA